jgi:Uma2 family endonuclease
MAASTIAASGTTQEQLDAVILELLPAQGYWSEDAYLWLTDGTNHLIEFTDGYIEVLPIPTEGHQTLLLYLYELLRMYFAGAGKILVAPLRLRIRPRKYREPDLLLVRDVNDPRRGNRYWDGADLVVEIVSPDKPERDLVEKRRDYAEAKVPEYWIVNPLDQTVVVLRLDDGTYVEHGVFGRGNRATSALLTGFEVEVNALFDAA